jgi:hypothetical protein
MIFTDFFAALLFGLVIVYSLSRTFGTNGPWGSFPAFWAIVVLFAWTAGVWLRPYGPLWIGISWMPIVFVGFLSAMLLAAISSRNAPHFYKNKRGSVAAETQKADVDIFFWILIFCLALLAMSHIFWFPQFGWH